jgi:transcriptional regulator with XRE-family HTH domain
MQNQSSQPVGHFSSFEELFQRAEQRTGYWVELAKLEFTEEMLARMKAAGLTKSQLATTLGAKPAFVTRLASGHNNFTLETMVRIALALNCEFRSHLQPAGTKTCWINVLRNEPQRPALGWPSGGFQKPKTIRLDFCNAPVTAAA